MDIRFRHPATFLLAGMTGSGKTVWLRNLIKNHKQSIVPEIQRVIWFYGQHQSFYETQDLPLKVEYYEGLDSSVLETIKPSERTLLILDDLAIEMEKDKRLAHLFTRESHHKGISVVFITQNLFQKSPILRTVSLNAHVLVLFKNPRDKSQIYHLARQVQPTRSRYVIESYIDATARPYGYLIFDLTQLTPDEYRLRTNIFPEDPQPAIAYVPR